MTDCSEGMAEVAEVRFAARSAWAEEESGWARALAERRTAGLEVFDLTASNPTQCGLAYDAERLLAPLRDPAALAYDPDPRGMGRAREAVAGYYADHLRDGGREGERTAGLSASPSTHFIRDGSGRDDRVECEGAAGADPEQIFLTTSTSEAYSYLFRLLCDPGDEVLIAQPSYPLFDLLATIDDVRLAPYPLFYDHGWHLDPFGLRQRITPRTRAIVVVHPNNPTGHFTKAGERRELEAICAEHGLALIADEVFLDYGLNSGLDGSVEARSFAVGPHPALTFVLSGLSKVAALPQMKVSWIAAFGPEPPLGEALRRLEIIADTFLSMNAPVQCALPSWLAGRAGIQRQIRERVQGNLRVLDELLVQAPLVTRLVVEAGWYAVLRVPVLRADAETALRLLEDEGVAVHPGHFFGFAEAGWLVVSLLTVPAEFREGVRRLLSSSSQ